MVVNFTKTDCVGTTYVVMSVAFFNRNLTHYFYYVLMYSFFSMYTFAVYDYKINKCRYSYVILKRLLQIHSLGTLFLV